MVVLWSLVEFYRTLALVLIVQITDFQSVTLEMYMYYWLVAMLIADFDDQAY